MFKTLFIFLLISLLALGPVTGFARQSDVRGGSFPDGASVQYLCEGKTGVKFLFTSTEGVKYQAELFCGDIV